MLCLTQAEHDTAGYLIPTLAGCVVSSGGTTKPYNPLRSPKPLALVQVGY